MSALLNPRGVSLLLHEHQDQSLHAVRYPAATHAGRIKTPAKMIAKLSKMARKGVIHKKHINMTSSPWPPQHMEAPQRIQTSRCVNPDYIVSAYKTPHSSEPEDAGSFGAPKKVGIMSRLRKIRNTNHAPRGRSSISREGFWRAVVARPRLEPRSDHSRSSAYTSRGLFAPW